jgi:hemerythrin superfamily protein
MSILDTLSQEHRRFETLLSDLTATSGSDGALRLKLFDELQSRLIAHSRAEEEVVYRVLRARCPDEERVLEGYEEHHIADVLLQELAAACPGGRGWAAKTRVFEEVLRHHIKEEETDLFPLVSEHCGESELWTMRAEYRAVQHSGLEAAMGPLRRALPAFAGRALVDVQAMAGRYTRRGELHLLRSLETPSALRNALPRSIGRYLPDVGARERPGDASASSS